MRHDHRFEPLGDGRTRMVDDFQFASPFGPLGTAVDVLVLERYLRRLLSKRTRALRSAVE